MPRHCHVVRYAAAAQRGLARALRALRPNPGDGLKTLRLRVDGGARGNPGPAALGVVIEDEQGMRLRTFHRYLGKATNNVAEYWALIDGLKALEEWKPDRLEIFLDSKLVAEQVKGKWKVKEPDLQKLHKQATGLLEPYGDRATINQVPREQNRGADKLVNMALDDHAKTPKSKG